MTTDARDYISRRSRKFKSKEVDYDGSREDPKAWDLRTVECFFPENKALKAVLRSHRIAYQCRRFPLSRSAALRHHSTRGERNFRFNHYGDAGHLSRRMLESYSHVRMEAKRRAREALAVSTKTAGYHKP